MVVSSVSVCLMDSTQPVLALVQIEFDHCFVVKDIRIIRGRDNFIIAMPSRKKHLPCDTCRAKNPVGAAFCNQCGLQLPDDVTSNRRLHSDIAHPITAEFRNYLADIILKEFEAKQSHACTKSIGRYLQAAPVESLSEAI
jgi:stage V sporulation protein G